MTLFKKAKPIIGMVHLGYFPSHKKFLNEDKVAADAIQDILVLQGNYVDAILIENWNDNTSGQFISEEDYIFMGAIIKKIKSFINVPFGINILPNDYPHAFSLAAESGASFVQLDVLVDHVATDYSYSDAAPFEVHVDLEHLKKVREQYPKIQMMATIHPKHYKMLEAKTLEESALAAEENGADILVITGIITGRSPDMSKILSAKKCVKIPIFIGSGLDVDNCEALLSVADGAIVGTAFKNADFSKVVPEKVERIMQKVEEIREKGGQERSFHPSISTT